MEMNSNYTQFTAQRIPYLTPPSIFNPSTVANFSVPPPNWLAPACDSVESRLEKFLSARNLLEPLKSIPQKRVEPTISLGSVKEDYKTSQVLINNLQSIEKQFSEDMSSEAWDQLVSHAETIKSQLKNIESKYSDSETISYIEKLYQRRQKKRLRLKRRNANLKIQRTEAAQHRKEEHTRIDQWQHKIQTQLQKEKDDKIESDNTKKILSDVTKKIADAEKYLTEFHALIELRRARKIAMQASDLGEKDFEMRIHNLELEWQTALKKYQKEEVELKQLLLEKRALNDEKRTEKLWNKVWFGVPVTKLHDHPLLRAEKDLNEFIQIRRAWDFCLVDDNDEIGTSIPNGWVVPSSDPLPEWRQHQEENKF